jgi:tetratricopeptide (TPR) repeat protein
MCFKKKILITLLLFLSVLTYAQLPFSSTKSKKADKLFGEALKKYTAMDYYSATELLNKSVKEDPNFIDAWMLLADIKGKNEKYDESIKLYEKVIGLNPEFPLSYYGIAKDAIELSNYQLSFDNITKFNNYQDYFGKKNSAEKIKRIAEFGKEAIKQPIQFNPTNLGPGVNTFENEYWPGVTADGQTLIFT